MPKFCKFGNFRYTSRGKKLWPKFERFYIPYIMASYKSFTHTYIHTFIGHYNTSVRITAWLFTPLMSCVLILYISGGTYSLKSTPNDRLFGETFHGNFIYSASFCQKSAERKLPKKYFSFFHISFWCLTWDMKTGFTSNKPTLYLLDYMENY